jgi:hypothetical protein
MAMQAYGLQPSQILSRQSLLVVSAVVDLYGQGITQAALLALLSINPAPNAFPQFGFEIAAIRPKTKVSQHLLSCCPTRKFRLTSTAL